MTIKTAGSAMQPSVVTRSQCDIGMSGRRPDAVMMTLPILLALAAAPPASADSFTFEGRIETYKRAELSSQLDGIVVDVLFTGGENVTAGMPLIVLDPSDTDVAVAQAEAAVKSAEAERVLAEQEIDRVRDLSERGVATPVQRQAAEAKLAVATADLASAEADATKAELDRERTIIRAAIDGVVGRPATVVGAFLEAKSGVPLGEIVQLDPVLVAYRVPYATRLKVMENTGAPSIEALFDRILLEIQVHGGEKYVHQAIPQFASAVIDSDDGAIDVWATVPNPDGLLRPGLDVIVHSNITDVTEGKQ